MRSQAPWKVARLELGSDASLTAPESGRRNAPPRKTIPSFLLSGAPALWLQVSSEVGAGSRLWGESGRRDTPRRVPEGDGSSALPEASASRCVGSGDRRWGPWSNVKVPGRPHRCTGRARARARAQERSSGEVEFSGLLAALCWMSRSPARGTQFGNDYAGPLAARCAQETPPASPRPANQGTEGPR